MLENVRRGEDLLTTPRQAVKSAEYSQVLQEIPYRRSINGTHNKPCQAFAIRVDCGDGSAKVTQAIDPGAEELLFGH